MELWGTLLLPPSIQQTLEGSFSRLRESIVTTLSVCDSLTRRHDIGENETLRSNEEISAVEITMHGLRMQVRRLFLPSCCHTHVVCGSRFIIS